VSPSNIHSPFDDDTCLLGANGDDYREMPDSITARHNCVALSAGVNERDTPWHYEHVFSQFGRLYYARHSRLFIIHNGSELTLPARHFLMIPPHLHFNCGHHGNASHLWIHFSDASAHWASATPSPSILKPETEGIQLAELLTRSLGGSLSTCSRFHLAQGLLALVSDSLTTPSLNKEPPKAFSRLLHALPKQLDKAQSVRALSEASGYTPEYLCNLFKKYCGTTPSDYIRRLRIREAARRLAHGSDTIDAISAETGFANRQHFTRVFSLVMKEPPAAFRQRLQNT
jgi:AraC-like DNA-binding protein